jgi:hypothetical protein
VKAAEEQGRPCRESFRWSSNDATMWSVEMRRSSGRIIGLRISMTYGCFDRREP